MGKKAQSLPQQAPNNDPSGVRADGDYRASEEFRAACEARYVLAKPFHERRKYLDGVGEKRGAAARAYLERVIHEEWKKKAPAKGG